MNLEIHQIFFVLFIVEQIINTELGSYTYLKGFLVARRPIPKDILIEDVDGFWGRLKIKKDNHGNIYLCHKYHPFTPMPGYVFVGQIKKENPTELLIRMGPLTALFFLVFFGFALSQGIFPAIGIFLLICSFTLLSFNSLLKGYEKILEREKYKKYNRVAGGF